MNQEKLQIMKNKQGFIAALDQSGGSTAKTLNLYGIDQSQYSTEEEMFDLVHQMRSRVIKSSSFSSDYIIGVILFEKTMNSKVESLYTADYLWNNKKILSFLKIDNGLADEQNGVRLMKIIPELEERLDGALEKNIFGTKMRSVILEPNQDGIEEVVEQQFTLAKKIIAKGLVPIIEPEVDINAPHKKECEDLLKQAINKELDKLSEEDKIIFKFTLPDVDNFYQEYISNPNVVRVVALSGGYPRDLANEKLSRNKGMIASFSRALLEGLNVNQTEEEFDKELNITARSIFEASK